MPEEKNIDTIIYLYLKGEAGFEDIQFLREWLAESETNKKQYELIRRYYESTNFNLISHRSDIAYSRLLSEINRVNYDDNETIKLPRTKNRLLLSTIAASFLILIIWIPLYWFHDNEKGSTDNQVSREITKENPIGVKSVMTLPDGSEVWLNAESTIEYPRQFGEDARRVYLTGEAFFEVKKNPDKPFEVYSGDLIVRVLGTSFNLCAFPNENEINLSLISGKVKVYNTRELETEKPIYLDPGDALTYYNENNTNVKRKFDPEYVTAWKNQKLILKDDDFDQFVNKIRRQFGVNVHVVGTPPGNFVVTGRFSDEESLESILKILQFGRPFEFEIDEKSLTLFFNYK